MVTFVPSTVPSSSLKTSLCCSNTCSKVVVDEARTVNSSFQFSRNFINQSLPSRLGPSPSTTKRLRSWHRCSYVTATWIWPNTLSSSPEYVRRRTLVFHMTGAVLFFGHNRRSVASLMRDNAAPVSICSVRFLSATCTTVVSGAIFPGFRWKML